MAKQSGLNAEGTRLKVAHTVNAWLFLGPEIGEKQAAIDELRKKLSGSGGLEETVYYAGETSVPAMVSHIKNASLFASCRLFLVKCVEGIKKKDDIDLFSSCLASLPGDAYVVLVSEETGVAKGLEGAVPQANKRIFWELADSRKADWVRAFFAREGFKISAEGVDTILELVENNTAALRQECSRLTLFWARARR